MSATTVCRAGSFLGRVTDGVQCFAGQRSRCARVGAADVNPCERIGEDQALGLEDAEQVTQGVSIGGPSVCGREPVEHVLARDLPKSAVAVGDLGEETGERPPAG
jgi:hypothetical protein